MFSFWIVYFLLCFWQASHCMEDDLLSKDGPKAVKKPPLYGSCGCRTCNYTRAAYVRGDFQNAAYGKGVWVSTRQGYLVIACVLTNGQIRLQDYAIAEYRSSLSDVMPWVTVDMGIAVTFDTFVLFKKSTLNKLLGLNVLTDGRVIHSFPPFSRDQETPYFDFEFVGNLTPPETGRFITVQRREGDYISDQIATRVLELFDIQVWVCKPDTYGNRGSGCRACPKECPYECDSYYGCKKVLRNAAVRRPTDVNNVGYAKPIEGNKDNIVNARMGSSQIRTCFAIQLYKYYPNGYITWTVFLGAMFQIEYVYITSRKDNGGANNLKDFYVFVMDNTKATLNNMGGNRICYHYKGSVATMTRVKLNCPDEPVGSIAGLFTENIALGFCAFEAFGYRIYDISIGGSCNPKSRIAFCGKDSTGALGICENKVCKKGIGGSCSTGANCTSNAVCDMNKCKLNYNAVCDPNNPTQCLMAAFCESTLARCKSRLGLSNSCTPGQDDRCPPQASCDILGRCGLKPNQVCRSAEQCTAGAQCEGGRCSCTAGISTATSDQCNPEAGRIGSDCSDDDGCNFGTCQNGKCSCSENQVTYFEDFTCRLHAGGACTSNDECGIGLVCETQTCHIVAGEPCLGNEQSCKSGTTCFQGYCRLEPGQVCADKEGLCHPTASCVLGQCKVMLGQNCSSYPQLCARGVCSDDGTCRIPATQPCTMDTARFCVEGASCKVNGVCKLNLGEECSSDAECQDGTYCMTRPGSQQPKCRMPAGSARCTEDDECGSDTVCDAAERCRIAKGGRCQQTAGGGLCVAGAECVNNRCQCLLDRSGRTPLLCGLPEGQVGGSCIASQGSRPPCSDPWAVCHQEDNVCQCGDNFVLDDRSRTCRLKPGAHCSADSNCTEAAICESDVCALKAGESCARDLRDHCNTNSVCEEKDDICRLNLQQNCANHRDDCRENTVCDVLNRCKYILGIVCLEDDECMAGSHCSNLRTNAMCHCKQSVTTIDGDLCVPYKGLVGGACQDGGTCQDENAVCSSDTGQCQCREGYTGEPATLTCAKDVGVSCSADSECSVIMMCGFIDGTCRYKLGQVCEYGGPDYCEPGSVCDTDNLCRLEQKGNCSEDKGALCKLGTFCDFLQQCSLAQGALCTREEGQEDPCAAGAECLNSECVCNITLSSVLGAVCEPRTGRFGGSCQAACAISNSRCENGVCACMEDHLPNRRFECQPLTEKAVHPSQSMNGGLVAVVVIAILIIVVGAAVLQRRKRPHPGVLHSGAGAAVSKTGAEPRNQVDMTAEEDPQGQPPKDNETLYSISELTSTAEESSATNASTSEAGDSHVTTGDLPLT